jgi:hypothetical protein
MKITTGNRSCIGDCTRWRCRFPYNWLTRWSDGQSNATVQTLLLSRPSPPFANCTLERWRILRTGRSFLFGAVIAPNLSHLLRFFSTDNREGGISLRPFKERERVIEWSSPWIERRRWWKRSTVPIHAAVILHLWSRKGRAVKTVYSI